MSLQSNALSNNISLLFTSNDTILVGFCIHPTQWLFSLKTKYISCTSHRVKLSGTVGSIFSISSRHPIFNRRKPFYFGLKLCEVNLKQTLSVSYTMAQPQHEALMSILDNDLYKFTMQHAVFKHYKRDIPVVYQFTNREKELHLNAEAVQWLEKQIKGICNAK